MSLLEVFQVALEVGGLVNSESTKQHFPSANDGLQSKVGEEQNQHWISGSDAQGKVD